jgi:hypothetical protein
MSTPARRFLLATALLLGLALPFVAKPVHIDDANFLVLARGARADLWRPHEVLVNWQGQTERAFDVLSNPPGIGWWLAPVAQAPVVVQHLWMLPWLLLLAWGAWSLGRRFGGDGAAAVLLLGSSPAAVLAAHALTPDLPLLALTVAGFGGYLAAVDAGRSRAAAGWAALAGCAVLFRYSGVALLPLLLLYPLLQRRPPWPGLAGALPLAALLLHDLHAYGELHILAMTGFQSTSTTAWLYARKAVAALAMLGAAGLLPALAPAGGGRAALPVLLGFPMGLAAAQVSGLDSGAALWTGACTAAGAVVLLGPLLAPAPGEGRRSDRLFLAAWALGGLVFLLALRFTATRYWLPFLPGVALAWLWLRPGRVALCLAVCAQILLSVGLAVDDQLMARAHQRAAAWADAEAIACLQCEAPGERQRWVAGHWGWQHALEQRGWASLEDEQRLRPGVVLAVASYAWPQQPHASTCLEPIAQHSEPDPWTGPRVHTAAGRANLHAFVIAGDPPLDTYAPWTLASDPYERVTLYRVCED